MPQVHVEFSTVELENVLKSWDSRIKNLDMDSLAQLLINETEEVIQSEGAAGTKGAWVPMSPATVKRKPRRAGGMLLQDTGALADIQGGSDGEYSVKVFSPPAYAGWHITGTGRMPERDFFALNFAHVLDEAADLVVLQEFQR